VSDATIDELVALVLAGLLDAPGGVTHSDSTVTHSDSAGPRKAP